jgi:hypothetical protein
MPAQSKCNDCVRRITVESYCDAVDIDRISLYSSYFHDRSGYDERGHNARREAESGSLYDRGAGTHAQILEARQACQMKTHQDFLEIACDAAQIGAKMLETSHPNTVHHKGDRDLVTDIDLAIQRDIDDYLRKATPDIALLAEESVELPDINTAEWLWVLDPIDGTSNFVHGLPPCSVSLALMYRGTSVVAVTQAPLLGRAYHAVEDQGAFLNGRPINVSHSDRLAEAIVSLGDYAVGPRGCRA